MKFPLDGPRDEGRPREARSPALVLWRSSDVAAFLDVSEATLSRWRKRGLGPGCIHVAGVARYRPETVCAWIESVEGRDGGADIGA
jgi:hypothetical protein